ncbi:mammalian cell entry protein [Mycobacterium sp. WMMD1722]|uniref:mammalian cell entry protein n=1 Tax=Mycobacterium sp. WMMD1722 TaxID=3404117 RepID=UPI003BF6150D
MADDAASATKPARRRASRAAGPAKGNGNDTSGGVNTGATPPLTRVRSVRPAGPPPRRQSHRTLVAAVALAVVGVALAALTAGVLVLGGQQRDAEAKAAREQRFVDTASQTAINMFSYTQDDIDESVNRFVDGTSGPLRDMLSQNNNVDNLKAIFRDTQASSEAVINGAALEKIDEVSDNAAVLVSVRVTVTDIDGTNKPSQPYRLRIIVHEDDNGHMTGYDLKYPDGGN